MNTVIYKYKLASAKVQDIEIPKGAELLTVKYQEGSYCVWARTNPQAKASETRTIIRQATGSECLFAKKKYLGTTMVNYNMTVYHWFEAE